MQLHLDSSQPVSLTPFQSTICSTWESFTKDRTITENATLLRYVNHDSTSITAAPDITYQDVVGLRFKQTPPTPPPLLALSALALVHTSDEQLFLQPRDSGDWPASLELPGGFIRAVHQQLTTTEFITERVARDLNLSTADITSVKLIAPYPFPTILEFMLVYRLTLTETKAELLTKQPKLIFLPKDYQVGQPLSETTLPLHYPSQIILEQFYR